MNRFAYETVGEDGLVEHFRPSRTPVSFADEVVRCVISPRYLDGKKRFSLVVWGAPEGVWPEDVPQSSYVRGNYIQCAGSTEAMTLEVRVTKPDKTYVHYVVAREPVADPDEWVTITWDNGNPSVYECRLHPEEVFTGEQATTVFRDYIERDTLPPTHLLRPINV